MLLRFLGMLLTILPLANGATALDLDSTYLSRIKSGLNLTLNERFGEARKLYEQMIASDSADHAAYLFLAGVHLSEMIDKEDYIARDSFYLLVEKALRLSEQAISSKRNRPWAHLTRGNAHAYLATFEAKAGSWFAALKAGLRAKNNYLDALEEDPRLYDAYLGLGNYHYWKSARTEFINWLPLVADRKEEGIRELQVSVDSSLFSRELALISLVWIHQHRGRPDLAFGAATEVVRRLPQSRASLWALAFASYHRGLAAETVRLFSEILRQIENQPEQNYFNCIECRYYRARAYLWQNRRPEAIEDLKALLAYPVGHDVRGRQSKKLRWARELVEEGESTGR